MIGRRQFVVGSAACLCGSVARAQWPTGKGGQDNSGQQIRRPVDMDVPVGGCGLNRTDALRAFQTYRISTDFDDEIRDAATTHANEVVWLYMLDCLRAARNSLGVNPDFGYYEDGENLNAFATPIHMFGSGTRHQEQDGSVLFGRGLLRQQLALGVAARSALLVIVAHECGHILQFKRARGGRYPGTELEADYLGGWALGRETLARRGMAVDPSVMAQTMFSIGGYNFNAPDFHGTPEQRRNAVVSGYLDGQRGRPLDAAYDRCTNTNWSI